MAKVKKIKNKTDIKRHPALIVACILLFLLAGLAAYWVLTRNSENNNDAATESSTSETVSTIEEIDETAASEEEDATVQYEGEDANTYENLTGAIINATVLRSVLTVNVTIDQSLTEGTCTMILTNGDEEMSYSADIEMDVQTSMCIFEEDVSLLVGGTWQIEVLLESGNRVGTITGSVEI